MNSTASTDDGKPRGPGIFPSRQDLKVTCDFCALSKVKCDRGRPRCQKCIRSDLDCHYSKKRRISKARQLCADLGSDGDSKRSVSSVHLETTPEREPQGHVVDWSKEAPLMAHGAEDSTPASSDLAMFLGLLDDPSQMEMAMPMDVSQMQQPMAPDEKNMHILDEGQCAERDELAYPNMAWAEPGGSGISSGGMGQETHVCLGGANEGRHCIRRLCAAIESLFPRCPRQGGGEAQTLMQEQSHGVDTTLEMGRDAIDVALEVLSCSCSSNGHIFSLLVLMVKQLMELYWNLSRQQCLFARPGTGSKSRRSPASAPASASASPDPLHIVIGSYVLDGEAQKKILLQVLQLEMARMNPFFRAIQSRAGPEEALDLVKSFWSYKEELVCSLA